MVDEIDAGGVAEKGDLQVGDTILDINQRDITGMNHEDIFYMIENSGTSVTLHVRRSGNI